MKILVIGSGYVGLVAAVCFADVGNKVICIDNDKNKIQLLQRHIPPFYEPGLEEMIKKNVNANRLSFSDDLKSNIENSQVIFICVGTPQNKDGTANLNFIYDVCDVIAKNIKTYKVIVNKSTAPVGTLDEIYKRISKQTKINFDIASNPEFLKQGAALNDFMHPDRTVIGVESEKAKKILLKLYEPFFRLNKRIIITDIHSAELSKYAANSFLAMKISYINEIANLCEKVGANIDSVREVLISDPRIGNQFLYPGIGYGGSCFPKDINALIKMGESCNYKMYITNAVKNVNDNQIKCFINKIYKEFNGKLKDKIFTIWGLSFKPKTSDVRDAPSLKVIDFLLKEKAIINVFDPCAVEECKKIYKNKINYFLNKEDSLKKSNCLIILTEWNEFRIFDYEKNKKLMSQCLVFDGRNQFDKKETEKNKFKYISVGR